MIMTLKMNHNTAANENTKIISDCFLTHWGRVTHICVSKLIAIGSDNGLSPGRRQAIIWTNAGILSIGPLETNFSEILIEIIIVSFKKMRLKVSSAIRRPFCLGLNVLMCLETVPWKHDVIAWFCANCMKRHQNEFRHMFKDIFTQDRRGEKYIFPWNLNTK